MIVKEMYLSPTTKIAEAYFKQDPSVCSMFDYDYHNKNVYIDRKKELETRQYDREKLADVIELFHGKVGIDEAVQLNIQKLKNERSLVVVGGQQPGLLTGPLYSIYKAITVIQLAKEQEEKLGVPVIPLFWIAGEDHDIAEVNHVYIENNTRWKKHSVKNPKGALQIASLTEKAIGPEEREWMQFVFTSLKETEHTQELQQKIFTLLDSSDTYVTFFAKMMHWLFKDEGLLLLDSSDARLRKLEQHVFETLVNENRAIHHKFLEQTEQLELYGYDAPIEKSLTNANLFYIDNGSRQRVDRADGGFTTKTRNFTLAEMQTIAKETPERLSNNVVTRPIMQEKILPVLAFVAGPGEIAYWASLQQVFHHLELKVPPVVPRLSATIVSRQVEKYLNEVELPINGVLLSGVDKAKENWLHMHTKWDVSKSSQEVKVQIGHAHQILRALAEEIDPSYSRLANKNLEIINGQIDYLEHKLQERIRQIHTSELNKFNAISDWLCPENKRQERFFHVTYLLNLYGMDFVSRILAAELDVNEQHKMFYL